MNRYDSTVETISMNVLVFNDGAKKSETVEEVYDHQIFPYPGISNTLFT